MEHFNSGNNHFTEHNFLEAINEFKLALAELKENGILAKCHSHMATALLEAGELPAAMQAVDMSISMDDSVFFPHFVKGKIFLNLGKIDSAKNSFLTAMAIDQTKAFIMPWIKKCEAQGGEDHMEENTAGKVVKEMPRKEEVITEEVKAAEPAMSVDEEVTEKKDEEMQVDGEKLTFPEPIKKQTIRRDWYQVGGYTFLTLYAKKQDKRNLDVEFGTKRIKILLRKAFPGDESYSDTIRLENEIIPEECTTNVSPYKIEIKLRKKYPAEWEKYENTDAPEEDEPMHYPSSAKKHVNYDQIGMGDDPEEDGDGLTKLLKDIYSKATPETRRAMNKSFVESQGTVLSTNWSEVGKGKVETKPPDGMEKHEYEA